MIRPTLTDLNLVELSYYQFMVSLDQCNANFNVVDDLSTKNMCPKWNRRCRCQSIYYCNKNKESRTLIKHILCDSKCKFNNTSRN